MGKNPRDEFEALFRKNYATIDANEIYFYLHGLDCSKCGQTIWLPYGGARCQILGAEMRSVSSDPLVWPSAGWSQVFGCIECGQIAPYAATQVNGLLVPKSLEDSWHAHPDVYLVTCECGDKDCQSPFSLHIDLSGYNVTTAATGTERAVDVMRSGVFDGQPLPCGHQYRTIPAPFYRATKITDRMW
jgi:hypothetical protein